MIDLIKLKGITLKDLENLKKKAKQINYNTQEFFVTNNISNEYFKKKNYIFNNNSFQENYIISQKMLKRSVQNVINFLKSKKNYNCQNYIIDSKTANNNIIKNITKNGAELIIIVRPTDYDYIKFHNFDEINELKKIFRNFGEIMVLISLNLLVLGILLRKII